MKKFVTGLAFSIFISSVCNAQCTSNGTSFGNNSSIPSYNVTGMVSVVLNSNNSVSLNLGSNFATASGPDVRVFLVDRGALTAAQLKVSSNFLARPRIEMGLITGNGIATFTQNIPVGTNISNFNTIYFYCQAFNAFWDFGSFTAFSTGNCSVLSTENFVSLSAKVFPNPAKRVINIDFNDPSASRFFNIYSVTSQKVLSSNKALSAKSTIDISTLKPGIYFLELVDGHQNSSVQKIIVEN